MKNDHTILPSVGENIKRNLAQRPNNKLFTVVDGNCTDHPFTYYGFLKIANSCAQLIEKLKSKENNIILICLPHQSHLFTSLGGAIIGGNVPVLMPPPSMKVSKEDYSRMMEALTRELNPSLVIADETTSTFLHDLDCKIVTPREIHGKTLEDNVVYKKRNINQPLLIQYSSGTTGLKKGVIISESSLIHQVDNYARSIGLNSDSSICSWLPLYHDMGLVCCFFIPLILGCHAVHISPFDWLSEPGWLLEKIKQEGSTHLWQPNFAFALMAKWARANKDSTHDLSSLDMVINCSEPITKAAQDQFIEAFSERGISPAKIGSCYAMAETTFAITSTTAQDPQQVSRINRQKLAIGAPVEDGQDDVVSSGRAIAGTAVKIMNEDQMDLNDGYFGHIYVKTDSFMDGYFPVRPGHPQFKKNDFFRTGDLGFFSDGHLYVIGRSDDMIIAYGANYDPVSIEERLSLVDGVVPGRVAVFSVESNDGSTKDIAILAESRVEDDQRRSRIALDIRSEVLKSFNFVPAFVEVVDHMTLRKSTSGKMSRSFARAYFTSLKERRLKERPDSSSTLRQKVEHFLATRCGIENIDGNKELISSGLLDSLGIVDLCLFLEETIDKPIPSPLDVGFSRFESIDSIIEVAEEVAATTHGSNIIIKDRFQNIGEKISFFRDGRGRFNSFFLSSSNFSTLKVGEINSDQREFFNFSCGGSSLPDFIAFSEFIQRESKADLDLIIISLDFERVAGFIDLPSASVMSVPEMQADLERLIGFRNHSNAEARDEVVRQRRINELRFGIQASDNLKTVLKPNGDHQSFQDGQLVESFKCEEDGIASSISSFFMRAANSNKISTEDVMGRLDTLHKILKPRFRRTLFLLPPYHPALFSVVFRDKRVLSELSRMIGCITRVFGDHARILNMADVKLFKGDKDDFIDGTHPGHKNGYRGAVAIRSYIDRWDREIG